MILNRSLMALMNIGGTIIDNPMESMCLIALIRRELEVFLEVICHEEAISRDVPPCSGWGDFGLLVVLDVVHFWGDPWFLTPEVDDFDIFDFGAAFDLEHVAF